MSGCKKFITARDPTVDLKVYTINSTMHMERYGELSEFLRSKEDYEYVNLHTYIKELQFYSFIKQVTPAVLRTLYYDLTGDAAVTNDVISKDIENHLRIMLALEDPSIIVDLHINNRFKGSTFNAFWDEMADDKYKVPIGEGVATSTGVRNKKSMVLKKANLVACDHDFIKLSLTSSVIFICKVLLSIEESFYDGQGWGRFHRFRSGSAERRNRLRAQFHGTALIVKNNEIRVSGIVKQTLAVSGNKRFRNSTAGITGEISSLVWSISSFICCNRAKYWRVLLGAYCFVFVDVPGFPKK
ncbi:hypothetical protein GLOIN_2v1766801 [Rhizophagus irregularis DAOM 181602=DAOM 197198]|nr:hypothetical protein GLOIN_2v1766801 [Rhizophagus irregularis DAOM 181602=DAOM 197198]